MWYTELGLIFSNDYHKHQILLHGDSRLVVSLCWLFVCLFVSCSCSRTKAAASILPLSKTFQRAHCIADANQRIKGTLQADKEGLMPTSEPLTTITGDFPASLAQCKTKWRATTTRYHNMAALSRDGHCLVTGRKGKRRFCLNYWKTCPSFRLRWTNSVRAFSKVSIEKEFVKRIVNER